MLIVKRLFSFMSPQTIIFESEIHHWNGYGLPPYLHINYRSVFMTAKLASRRNYVIGAWLMVRTVENFQEGCVLLETKRKLILDRFNIFSSLFYDEGTVLIVGRVRHDLRHFSKYEKEEAEHFALRDSDVSFANIYYQLISR